ncbi:hypothetical protein Bhyg_15227 [Pseudolycoriella hygida]|uniref:Uncharacterized protein n=1 Tax=Pseudolycoriella hygida TaxID=35572 RepID=A0A9Q0MRH2_9DIPT|nr:hypothetical protein Bhyg_15227 [Pseudolycoriella hygida]
MIFYMLLSVSPNLEIFLTTIYTSWCLYSEEILSFDRLMDKVTVCQSTDGVEIKMYVFYLRYAVSLIHILQFISAYVMLAAELLTIYPIIFNKSPSLLTPIIMASKFRQIYLNVTSVVLGAVLWYFSENDFKEFRCFCWKFLFNMGLSYYIIYSYEFFREYIGKMSSCFPAKSIQTLPPTIDFKDSVDSVCSRSSITSTSPRKATEVFNFNFIDRRTKENFLSTTITKGVVVNSE